MCVQRWSHGYPVIIGHELQKMSLDILASCIFGQDFDTLNGQSSEALEAYNFAMHNLFSPFRFIFPLWTKLPLPTNIKGRKHVQTFDDYCWEVIKKANQRESKTDLTEEDDSQTISLIDLLKSCDMKDSDIRDNIGIFFLAGHETTSSTLSWVLAMLASHPEVQEKARKEVLEKAPKGLTHDLVKDLGYIDWVIKETIRFYPALPTIGARQTKKDIVLGDWNIPVGSVVQIDLISMLYDPKIWGDPTVFRPERFSLENYTKEQRHAYMPFSTGSRTCIGINFSYYEQKIFIGTLLREFSKIEFSPDSELVFNTNTFVCVPDFEKLKIQFVKA